MALSNIKGDSTLKVFARSAILNPLFANKDTIAIAVGGPEGSVHICEMVAEKAGNRVLTSVKGHSSTITDVCIGFDGMLASADSRGQIIIWELRR
ncbi:hypothetical protein Ciccas_000579 [Cichlidogyrus casuarinus]|uniref:Uncharacterized protein n=1 Tax=Cichlidogyrus casuarinus TaxID=1844966 RepID=A0ABD2QMX6_9PLAT